MTTEILLIRHGSHDRLGRILCGRMPGVTLSREGLREAEALAGALARRGAPAALRVSPLERARETAAPLARAFGLEAEIDPDLDEIDFGAWSGQGFDALSADPAWAVWNRDRDHARPPGGETMAEAQARMVRALRGAAARHPDAAVAFVGHADTIKAALCWALGLPLAFLARFEVAPASVSRMLIDADAVRVRSLNEGPAA